MKEIIRGEIPRIVMIVGVNKSRKGATSVQHHIAGLIFVPTAWPVVSYNIKDLGAPIPITGLHYVDRGYLESQAWAQRPKSKLVHAKIGQITCPVGHRYPNLNQIGLHILVGSLQTVSP
jgi:hypothetical protein